VADIPAAALAGAVMVVDRVAAGLAARVVHLAARPLIWNK
jgi:hypothetical protein